VNVLAKLESDVKDAMRSGDVISRDTLRMVLASAKNQAIELGRDLEDADLLIILKKAVKTRQDSVEQYDAGNRPELAAKEREEIEVIQRYLPAEKSADEVRAIVGAIIEELGLTSKKEMGALMKAVMGRHKGEIDGRAVQAVAGELLE